MTCYAILHRSSTINEKTKEKVAIKKLHRPFQSEIFAKRAYRELRLLKHMKHENVIGLVDVFTPASSLDDFQDFYLVMPYMFTDLSKVRGHLSEDKVQFLVYQMLCGLRYIHKAGIIHRSLLAPKKTSQTTILRPFQASSLCSQEQRGNHPSQKSVSLLLTQILDFGLARSTDAEMTGYVVTRWYRAPEVILNWMHYTQTVDIWSVGCIMAEMINGKTLFKGKDYMDQLTQIMKVTGVPGPEFIQKLDTPEAKNYMKALPHYPRKDFSALFPRATVQGESNHIHLRRRPQMCCFELFVTVWPHSGLSQLTGLRICCLFHLEVQSNTAPLSCPGLCFREVKSFVPFPRRDSKRKNTLTMSP
ncbi:mitogen-activated protein kinase 13-like [Stegastes partitus]|uniref:mitogen-activated protein kinase n=1 Tax=Stegastes partitus TaxID=144197 RepID=A0A9Y4NNI8_9TELE|nr:PREDICTED: mitogen-activated protein kinase 13-like [Stegastes partitus]